jgi:hypothetical protein
MAIDMSSLRKVRGDKPPRLLIYGPEKMGKTSLAAEFPNPVFLQTEDGAPADLELDSFGHLDSFTSVLDAMTVLATQEHGFETMVLDSVSELERLVFTEVCTRNKWQTIEQPGYGKGYAEADYVWKEFIDGFNFLRTERNMTIVLIGHAVISRFDDPETQSYSRYELDLHKRAVAALSREVDAILLVKKDVTIKTEGTARNPGRARGDGGDTRWIYTEGRPAFAAGNRFSMPERILFEKGKGFGSLAQYLPINRPAAPVAAAKKKAA